MTRFSVTGPTVEVSRADAIEVLTKLISSNEAVLKAAEISKGRQRQSLIKKAQAAIEISRKSLVLVESSQDATVSLPQLWVLLSGVGRSGAEQPIAEISPAAISDINRREILTKAETLLRYRNALGSIQAMLILIRKEATTAGERSPAATSRLLRDMAWNEEHCEWLLGVIERVEAFPNDTNFAVTQLAALLSFRDEPIVANEPLP